MPIFNYTMYDLLTTLTDSYTIRYSIHTYDYEIQFAHFTLSFKLIDIDVFNRIKIIGTTGGAVTIPFNEYTPQMIKTLFGEIYA